jgi:uncharacterized membrane protein YkvA (DUF1232 family)
MTPAEQSFLDAFPAWLKGLGADAQKLSELVEHEGAAESVRRAAATSLNYLFKSLDLIPDGLEDIGFLDDAFVFRVAAVRVPESELGDDASGIITRLRAETTLIQECLGDVYPRLDAHVAELEKAKVRGRLVGEILSEPEVRAEFVREARAWADGYQPPSFLRDERNLVKLRSFLSAKLK